MGRSGWSIRWTRRASTTCWPTWATWRASWCCSTGTRGTRRPSRIVANELDGPVERLDPGATVAGFQVHEVVDKLLWQEAALHRPSDGTLYVPEALGTADYFTAGDDRLGVHPMLRFTPPRSLTELDVERLFVGHGAGITDGAGKTVASAIDRARRGAPRVWYEALRDVITR